MVKEAFDRVKVKASFAADFGLETTDVCTVFSRDSGKTYDVKSPNGREFSFSSLEGVQEKFKPVMRAPSA